MSMSDEYKRERAKLKGKGWKAHLEYFWDYYRIQTFVILFCAIFLIALIYTQVTAKDTAFEAVLLNSLSIDTETAVNADGQSFADYAGIDTDQYDVYIDDSMSLTPGTRDGQYDYATIMKITTLLAAREIDVMVADVSNFEYYALSDTFTDLREIYSDEELQAFEEEGLLWYVDGAVIEEREEASEAMTETTETATISSSEALENEKIENYTMPDKDTMEDPIPVGIVVSDAPYLVDNGFYSDTTVVAGVPVSSEHTDYAKQFIAYMMETN